jgi:hypothetical protein
MDSIIKSRWPPTMSRTNYLRQQLERAKRFAAAMVNLGDREKFEKIAADYQAELDASNAPASAADPSATPEVASSQTAATPSETSTSDSVSSVSDTASGSAADQPETKD